ncbi:hypothetical protein [Brevibacillus nitrificans]|uniref:hypothetical protein n=1 Tax=Brevibacillus nitrificans TaxID=651560 RepID=UPI0028655336|nr:hypothetical protein [Brevibacillus nitrificans]MDR7319028.1 hypothetical protein [Brevibacillus nitrificans]
MLNIWSTSAKGDDFRIAVILEQKLQQGTTDQAACAEQYGSFHGIVFLTFRFSSS